MITFNIEEAKRLYRSGIIVSRKKMEEGDFITYAYITFLKCQSRNNAEKGRFRDYYCKALKQNIQRWIVKDSEVDNHNYQISQGNRKRDVVADAVSPEILVSKHYKTLNTALFGVACGIACHAMGISVRDQIIWSLSHDTKVSGELCNRYRISRQRLSQLRIAVRTKLLTFFQKRGIELEDFYV